MVLVLNAAAGSEAKLARFLADITSEEGGALGGPAPTASEMKAGGSGDRSEAAPAAVWKGGGKGE
jgi:hypothetical protein